MRLLLDRAKPIVRDSITITAETAYANDSPKGAVALAEVAPKGSSEALQGWHHENMVIIIDEASGVEDDAIDALEGCCTNPNNILIMVGNPTRLSGRFFEAFHKARSSWYCLHFSGPDSRLVSQEYLDGLATKYGENSNIYRVRGLGFFPLSDADSLILLEWIEAAVERAADDTHSPVRIGVDPARSTDGDATGLLARSGNRVLAAEQFWVADLTPVQGRARNFRDRVMGAVNYLRPKGTPPVEFDGFYVDTVGLGAGVHDGLRASGEKSTAVNVALPPTKKWREPGEIKPANMRAELWLAVKDWLKDDGGSLRGLLDSEELDVLTGELSAPRYDTNKDGAIVIEPKAVMKKRLKCPSPNLADALCLTFADSSIDDSWAEFYRREAKGG
jgi:hypothetical protein